jgi:two-component system chemotaxis response regulator CheB
LQVIALVGSAGGLAAVSEVLSGLPAGLNAAVIVLIHQAPERENKLVEILARPSRLPVEAARDHTPLRAGTVVVAPPGEHVLIAAGPMVRLIASGASPPSRPSADLLLATLATACGPRATAVVLSGGGHDGATGATAVHQFGGTVLASDELTSEHFSMPQATIERDSVIDQIVPLGEIATLLVSGAPHPGESQKPAHEPNELVPLARERERVAAEREHVAEEREERAEARLEREQQAERRALAGAGRQTAATQRREQSAEKRNHLANERERIADERERAADVRERAADERERLADEREGTAEQREVERRERAEAADERQRQAQRRDQAQINREIAATQREIAREERDGEATQDSATRAGTD